MGDCEEPYFAFPNYDVRLAPDTPVGTTIQTARGDDITEGDVLRYRISGGNSENRFAIDAATGEITTRSTLGNGPYALALEVRDSLNQTDTITVNVYISNTYTARFERGGYSVIEGGEVVAAKVVLDRPVTEPIIVGIAVGYNYYVDKGDIDGVPVIVHFEIGDSEKTFPVWATSDGVDEATEWVSIQILRGTGFSETIIGAEPWYIHLDIEDEEAMQETLWETTMTVGSYGDLRGYSVPETGAPEGSLGSSSFTWRGSTYTVSQLYDSASTDRLRVEFDGAIPEDASRVVLNVGEYRLPFASGTLRSDRAIEWSLPITWTAGDQLSVSLVQAYEAPDG